MTRTITKQELAAHNTEESAWVAVEGKVYDVTKFARFHPGGKYVLVKACGKDQTEAFKTYHNDSVLAKYHSKFYIGDLEGGVEQRPIHAKGANTFGEMVPYGDPSWYQGMASPYYKETHYKWRNHVRSFVEREIMPRAYELKALERPDPELLRKLGKAGILCAMLGPPWKAEYVDADTARPDDYDYFHCVITWDEISRCGVSPVIAALTNGPSIACAAILHYGSEQMRRRVLPDVLMGRKIIALAISEPQTGSDVAGMVTESRPDGNGGYIINGNKKWITTGTYADFFTTAVKSGPARGQQTLFLIERGLKGFSTRKIDIRDSVASGTAYLDFDNCRVTKADMIGREHYGMRYTFSAFVHERMYVAVIALRLARVCLEESIRYALRRQAFGKNLASLQSIRMSVARMATRIECYQAWVEQVSHQFCVMEHRVANEKMGPTAALIKAEASAVYRFCAEESVHVFGGNALYMNGVGRKIEPATGAVKAYAIPAGAERVMLDWAGRDALTRAAKFAKL